MEVMNCSTCILLRCLWSHLLSLSCITAQNERCGVFKRRNAASSNRSWNGIPVPPSARGGPTDHARQILELPGISLTSLYENP